MLRTSTRTTIMLAWLVLFVLMGVSAWPMPVAMAALVVFMGFAVPAMIFVLLEETPQRVAEVLHLESSASRERGALPALRRAS